MARRSQTDVEVPDESTPGGGVSPATDAADIAPGASEDPEVDAHDASEKHIEDFITSAEAMLSAERGRQTLTGAVLVARSIIFAGVLIARAIRESRKATS